MSNVPLPSFQAKLKQIEIAVLSGDYETACSLLLAIIAADEQIRWTTSRFDDAAGTGRIAQAWRALTGSREPLTPLFLACVLLASEARKEEAQVLVNKLSAESPVGETNLALEALGVLARFHEFESFDIMRGRVPEWTLSLVSYGRTFERDPIGAIEFA